MSTKRAFEERDRELLKGDSNLFPPECPKCNRVDDLIEACECVVATAFGNIEGLTLAEQLTALRMASACLNVELESYKGRK